MLDLGWLDYIETIRRWRQRFAQPSSRKRLMKLQLVPRWLTSPAFRIAFTSGVSANSVCFERELLEHYRLVFEKPAEAPDLSTARTSPTGPRCLTQGRAASGLPDSRDQD